MKISRRNFCLLMAGACCTGVLAACGSSSSSTSSSSAASASAAASGEVRDELIFVNYRDIRDLNPHLYAGEMYAQSILYDTLVSITADGYEGCLAESWDISEDGRTYTFHIRPNVLFSDGEKCDANAILANFNAILENRERHTWLEMMNLLVGVSAPDENTFVIEMSEPYYPMLTELGCIRPFAMISPSCMINGSTKDGVNGHIGTGPYVLTDFVTDEYAVFERNENYWGKAPAIRKITVKVIPDNQTRIMALESGEIDLIFGKNMIDADAISQYLDSDRFTVGLSDPTSTRHIVMNTTREILGDPAVRKALQHATDRQTISDGIFYGLEQPADTLYATTVPYCNVGLKPYEYSTETAAQILDEAGWALGSDKMRAKDGRQLALDLLYNSDSVTEKTIAEYLQSEYLKLGISMTIHGEEEQSYRDNMKAGNFDMVFNICWGMPYDPQSSLAAMRAPVYGDYAAQQGLEDKAEIDEAITKILTSTDEAERQELYKSVLTNLHEDAMYLPLTYECNKALYTSALHGVHFGTDQYDVPFADMYFE
ncbi:nickel ABC transporter substrate-binding protein [Faecalibacterium prausnitzii]|uniref:nickel ABC transporter substrate-binding protein n=1 Tax=Faecalibacterium prausnitzii TaxID=853 RepID=UPI001170F284|nr:nickel ABC transporter substrate-binding protein [Faecalibacterium prausnitzii]VUX17891.1 Nickel-binding periplasmic protein precursor [Faecalibacterium prausnitzii]